MGKGKIRFLLMLVIGVCFAMPAFCVGDEGVDPGLTTCPMTFENRTVSTNSKLFEGCDTGGNVMVHFVDTDDRAPVNISVQSCEKCGGNYIKIPIPHYVLGIFRTTDSQQISCLRGQGAWSFDNTSPASNAYYCEQCKGGKVPNADHTECVASCTEWETTSISNGTKNCRTCSGVQECTYTCNFGYYLNNNECTKCEYDSDYKDWAPIIAQEGYLIANYGVMYGCVVCDEVNGYYGTVTKNGDDTYSGCSTCQTTDAYCTENGSNKWTNSSNSPGYQYCNISGKNSCYRCAAGYWGSSKDGKTGCTKCEQSTTDKKTWVCNNADTDCTPNYKIATASEPGATSENQCYIPQKDSDSNDIEYHDDTGTKVLLSNCHK